MSFQGAKPSRGRYGRHHRMVRAALLPFAYGQPCHLCGEVMQPGQRLHLDHTVDGAGYRGMVHARCNVQDGARRGRAKQLRGRGGVF